MKEKRFFKEPVLSSRASFAKRLDTAGRIIGEICRRQIFPDGLRPAQAAMVAIREAGCGGFDKQTRRMFKEHALEVHFVSRRLNGR